MKLTNLAGILDFLNFLDEKGKSYYIKHTIPVCLTVMIFLPGLKYEVYFYEDRVDYSLFQGDESVRDDLDEMLKVLSEE